MDRCLENKVKSCTACQLTRHAPPRAPVAVAIKPLEQDPCGLRRSKMFLIAVDAHSKWMEVAIVQSATSAATIEKAQKPIRYTWVARNVSFRQWNMLHKPGIQRVHGIQHVKTAPYHPSSNGQAES